MIYTGRRLSMYAYAWSKVRGKSHEEREDASRSLAVSYIDSDARRSALSVAVVRCASMKQRNGCTWRRCVWITSIPEHLIDSMASMQGIELPHRHFVVPG